MKYILPTIIAIIMLLIGIPKGLSYDYYIVLRWVVTVVAGILAYKGFDLEQQGWGWIMVLIALLFNPIFPIHLAKETWVVIDFIVAGILFSSLFLLKDKNQRGLEK